MGSFNAKPYNRGVVDFSRSVCQGMCGCYLFNDGGKVVRDIVGKMGNLNFVGATPPVWSSMGLTVGNGKGYAEGNGVIKSAFNPVLGNCTVRIVHIPRSWPGGFTTPFDCFASGVGSGRIWNIFASSSAISYRGIGGADGSAAANSLAMATGQINDLVFVRRLNDTLSGSTQVHYWYLNGKLIFTETGFSNTSWPTGSFQISLGGNPSGGGSAFDGTYVLAQMWNRALQRNEPDWLYSNPWGFLAPVWPDNDAFQVFNATTFSISINDSLALSDTISRQSNSLRLISSNLALQDATSRLSNTMRIVSDNLAISDTMSRAMNIFRTISDNLVLTDFATTLSSIKRVILDNLSITDLASRQANASRIVSDNLAITDFAATLVTVLRLISDNLGVGPVQPTNIEVLRQVLSFRSVSDNFSVSDNILRIASAFRSVSDIIGITDTTTLFNSIAILIMESFGVSDQASRIANVSRFITDNLKLSEFIIDSRNYSRLISDNLGMLDAELTEMINFALIFGIFAEPAFNKYFEGPL